MLHEDLQAAVTDDLVRALGDLDDWAWHLLPEPVATWLSWHVFVPLQDWRFLSVVHWREWLRGMGQRPM
jgi:hypothetical protein